jgi:hypothetical protein
MKRGIFECTSENDLDMLVEALIQNLHIHAI